MIRESVTSKCRGMWGIIKAIERKNEVTYKVTLCIEQNLKLPSNMYCSLQKTAERISIRSAAFTSLTDITKRAFLSDDHHVLREHLV
jgi:hypothetical protein